MSAKCALPTIYDTTGRQGQGTRQHSSSLLPSRPLVFYYYSPRSTADPFAANARAVCVCIQLDDHKANTACRRNDNKERNIIYSVERNAST